MPEDKLRSAKLKIRALCAELDEKIRQQFGFRARDVTLGKVVDYLHAPKDSSSLAVTRILFGVAMLFDICNERGGATMTQRWGNPTTCHFPLLPVIRAIQMPYMALVYAVLWFGALGIALGYKYRVSSIAFTLCYWYLFLIEKSYWNNHSYLFGLVATLLSFTDAHCYWSIDAASDPSIKKTVVPYWNYFILKYQFFILYFMAGLKKGTPEWLTGYSVQNLSEHWVFNPFKPLLTLSQIDFWIVHYFVFAFDLTVAFWMMWERTRDVAMVFCAMFHLMNNRLFSIGMFPWVCLATMPLFCPFDWPKIFGDSVKKLYRKVQKETCKWINIMVELNYFIQDTQENEEYIEQIVELDINQEEEDFNELKLKENDNLITEEENLKDETDDSLKDRDYLDKVMSLDCNEPTNAKRVDIDNQLQNIDVMSLEETKTDVTDNRSKDIDDKVMPNNTDIVNEKATTEESDNRTKDIDSEVTALSDISKKAAQNFKTSKDEEIKSQKCVVEEKKPRKLLTLALICFLVITQLFLPFSHFITKGFNNWTNGLYGYSWDMMVHTWDIGSVVVKVVDNENDIEFYMDPHFYAPNDRWTRHGDMLKQYAQCIKEKLLLLATKSPMNKNITLSNNLSVYIDVWNSMNGRFMQRMFDSRVDLLNVDWSVFEPIPYLMPVLDEALEWRSVLQDIKQEVHSWHNTSDVIFIADFPGYVQEKFISTDLDNVTLTVLEGTIAYEPDVSESLNGQSYILTTGDRMNIKNGMFHKILSIGETATYIMYTFVNVSDTGHVTKVTPPQLPIATELAGQFKNMLLFANNAIKSILEILSQFTKCTSL